MPTISPLNSRPDHEIETLLDAAFGADRHGRTAYAVRAGMSWLPNFSYALADGRALLGVLQSWPVELAGDDGVRTPLIMVGPVAVLPDSQREGLGRMMMDRLIEDTDRSAASPLMMIGDPEYYSRFWGFAADKTGGWRVPGPIDPRRLLMRDVPHVTPLPALSGLLGPRNAPDT